LDNCGGAAAGSGLNPVVFPRATGSQVVARHRAARVRPCSTAGVMGWRPRLKQGAGESCA
jgi:hypothetical protein